MSIEANNKGRSQTEGVLFQGGLLKEELSANTTLDEEDVGKQLLIKKSGLTITLPATVVGYVYHIWYDCDTKQGTLAVSPNSSDKIMGIDVTDVDNKDLNLASGQKGDHIVLIGDGSLGWYVVQAAGSWSRET